LRFDPETQLEQNTVLAKIGRTSGYTTGVLNAFGITSDSLLALGIHFAAGHDAELSDGKKVRLSYASDLATILQPESGLNLAWLDE
jgi:hypothetical protein